MGLTSFLIHIACAFHTSHVAVDIYAFTLKDLFAQRCEPSRDSATFTTLAVFASRSHRLLYLCPLSSFRLKTDPLGAASHSFIGRKETQEGTEKDVGGLLRLAKGRAKKY